MVLLSGLKKQHSDFVCYDIMAPKHPVFYIGFSLRSETCLRITPEVELRRRPNEFKDLVHQIEDGCSLQDYSQPFKFDLSHLWYCPSRRDALFISTNRCHELFPLPLIFSTMEQQALHRDEIQEAFVDSPQNKNNGNGETHHKKNKSKKQLKKHQSVPEFQSNFVKGTNCDDFRLEYKPFNTDSTAWYNEIESDFTPISKQRIKLQRTKKVLIFSKLSTLHSSHNAPIKIITSKENTDADTLQLSKQIKSVDEVTSRRCDLAKALRTLHGLIFRKPSNND